MKTSISASSSTSTPSDGSSMSRLFKYGLLVCIVLTSDRIFGSLKFDANDSNNVAFMNMNAPVLVQDSIKDREPRLGDGCYHVYLDVGANRGNHGRFLFEPHKYPNSQVSVPLFEKEFGENRDNRDICVFEFEANPKHWPYLHKISEAYARMGWRYHVVEAAVSDFDGNYTFYHSKQSFKNLETGFSGSKYRDGQEEKFKTDAWEETVQTIHLSKWIQHHIYERQIPDHPPSNTTSSVGNRNDRPILSMKMDIEAFEYIVLPDLIHSGAICGFTFVFAEYHDYWAPMTFDATPDLSETHLNSTEAAHDLAKAISRIMVASRQCPVRFFEVDDESYPLDSTPLPTP